MRHVKQVFCVALVTVIVLAVAGYVGEGQEDFTPEAIFTPADTQTGYLYEDEYESYSFTVYSDAEKITLTLSGPSTGDFDLFANYGSTAIPGSSSYSSEGLSSYEQIVIDNPSSGTWYTSVYAYSGYGSYTLTLDVDYEDTTTTTTTTTTTGSSGGSTSTSTSTSTTSTSTNNPYTQNPYTESTSSTPVQALGVTIGTTMGYVIGGGVLGLIGLYIIKSRLDSSEKREEPSWEPTRYSGPSSSPRSSYSSRESYSPPKRDYTDRPSPGERYQPKKRYQPDDDDAPDWG
ncbi:MAG: PPC domain-containing protein [Candidatus Thorarchaeota archaeon]|nr:PPC domain-containing protein [Candidatus Thorarchaeota archaeon]